MKAFFLLTFLLPFFQVFSQPLTTIQFQKTTHDFGDIKEEAGPVTYEFVFTNTGSVPFKIDSVASSCGCTTPLYSNDPVKPGKTGFVRATFDPKNFHGPISKMITVKGNSKETYYLTIRANVIPKPLTILDEFPAEIGNLRFKTNNVVFDTIFHDQVDTGYVRMYNPTDKAILIKFVKGPLFLRYSKLPMYVPPKAQAVLKVYYSAYQKNDLGYVFDPITLITDDAVEPEKEIIIVANIVQNFKTMTPAQIANTAKISMPVREIDLGIMKDGDIKSCEFKFKNTGNSKLVIYDVKSSCGCAATTLGIDKLDPGQESSIKVTFNSKNYRHEVRKEITVNTNDPDNKTIILVVKAFVEAK